MENNNEDGVWITDMLCGERLKGLEKLLRDTYRIADELYMLINIKRYPLVVVPDLPQYDVTVSKVIKNKWVVISREKGMELEIIFNKVKRKLEEYKREHKDYLLTKSNGGEPSEMV